MTDLIRTSHVRCFFTKDDEGNSDHAVGDAAAEVAGIDDPDQHLFAEERRDDGQEADEQKRIDRRLIFIVQFGKTRGIIYDSAMEYIARLPPMRKEFQLVMMPQRPPMMRTLAMMELPKATAMASAVTRPPTLFMATEISALFMT